MTKTLILMRHAKSSWKDLSQPDYDRPLNKRGRLSATAMGEWLRSGNWVPDQALVSTSQRTRQTWDMLGFEAPATFDPTLYHAMPHQLGTALSSAKGKTVLMLAHNPGMALFASQIVQAEPDHPRFRDFPTCATLVVRFDISNWADLMPNSSHLLGFAIPREVLGRA